MKKIILLAGAMLLLLAGQSAQAVIVVTTCGKAIMTVGPEGYNGPKEEDEDYLRDVNVQLCGTTDKAMVADPRIMSVESMTEYHRLAELTLDLKFDAPTPSQSK